MLETLSFLHHSNFYDVVITMGVVFTSLVLIERVALKYKKLAGSISK
jgi:hypothetical protein|tara:strand:+ start:69 stop:209 length:141 start_codon:yes stop_codon:yes gene_type:complete